MVHSHRHHHHQVVLHQFRHDLHADGLLHDGDTIGTDDLTLLRFLKARHFNLKQAKIMWKNCYDWRMDAEGVGIDELYRKIDPWDYPEREHVFNCWPLWFHKTDKKGRPLNVHFFGGINMPELYKHITPERHWQTVLVNCEALTKEVLPAASKAANKHIDGTFVIVDLKDFSLSQFWQMKSLARQSFQVSQDYFPETMAQLAIVNAPSTFTTIWSFIKPWLAKETVEKVDILGSDYQDVLLKLIDKENLPKCLGGECTCEVFGGCERSNAGPWSVDRKERRERWLRGEGELVGGDVNENGKEEKVEVPLQEIAPEQPKSQDLQNAVENGDSVVRQDDATDLHHATEAEPSQPPSSPPSPPPGAFKDAFKDGTSSPNSSEESTLPPATPPVQDLQDRLQTTSLEEGNNSDTTPNHIITKEPIKQVSENPPTRQIQNDDLHLDGKAGVAAT